MSSDDGSDPNTPSWQPSGYFAGTKGPPSGVADWFALLPNKLVGLALLNAFDLVNYALVGLIFLGLYAALRRFNKAMMTLALLLGFLGIGIYFASNQAFPLLALSDQYAAVTSELQRTVLLNAGQVLLALIIMPCSVLAYSGDSFLSRSLG